MNPKLHKSKESTKIIKNGNVEHINMTENLQI